MHGTVAICVPHVEHKTPHGYSVGDKAYLLLNKLLGKNAIDREGPYEVIDVFTNGTVAIRRGALIQTVSIRRLVPHF